MYRILNAPKLAGEGNGTPPQYSCLENPMDGGAWWAAVHGVAKSQTGLSDFTFTFFHPSLNNTDNPSGNSLPFEFLLGSSAWVGEKVLLSNKYL